MGALGGGAVSYERGTPVEGTQRDVSAPREQEGYTLSRKGGFKSFRGAI